MCSSGENACLPPMWPGLILAPGVTCGLSLLLVLSLVRAVFPRILRFSPFHRNQHCHIPIRSGMHGHKLKRAPVALIGEPWINKYIKTKTCSKHVQGTIAFLFASNWLKNWCEIS